LNQLIGALNQILGTRIKSIHEPARAGDVRHSVADVSKAKKLLDYAPKVSFEEGLQRVLDWYRLHREGRNGAA
jgi:nucleoside-diphosphate-sugar epimerase